jgi:hypothetical protein
MWRCNSKVRRAGRPTGGSAFRHFSPVSAEHFAYHAGRREQVHLLPHSASEEARLADRHSDRR